MAANIILGLQWGDEGKGKLVDALSTDHQLVCRFQGGPNAGHTIYVAGKKFVLHQIPSGIFTPGVRSVIGNGVVLDPITLADELQQLKAAGLQAEDRLMISSRVHLILPSHRWLDAANETQKGERKIGSTLRGIGPCYQDKYARVGLRVADLRRPDRKERLERIKTRHAEHLGMLNALPSTAEWEAEWARFEEACALFERLQVLDTELFIGKALQHNEAVLVEGAQGTLLDIDFGSYPYVTSSHTIAGGACVGLGIAPQHIQDVIGVFKAYLTRVGNGPFPTEQDNPEGEKLREMGHEFGATTGRPRRTGWLDLPALRYAILLNGVTALSIMKVDVLCGLPEVKVCTHYQCKGQRLDYLPAHHEEDAELEPVYETLPGWTHANANEPLPAALEHFLAFIERQVQVPIRYVSVGPGRDDMQFRAPSNEQAFVG